MPTDVRGQGLALVNAMAMASQMASPYIVYSVSINKYILTSWYEFCPVCQISSFPKTNPLTPDVAIHSSNCQMVIALQILVELIKVWLKFWLLTNPESKFKVQSSSKSLQLIFIKKKKFLTIPAPPPTLPPGKVQRSKKEIYFQNKSYYTMYVGPNLKNSQTGPKKAQNGAELNTRR